MAQPMIFVGWLVEWAYTDYKSFQRWSKHFI